MGKERWHVNEETWDSLPYYDFNCTLFIGMINYFFFQSSKRDKKGILVRYSKLWCTWFIYGSWSLCLQRSVLNHFYQASLGLRDKGFHINLLLQWNRMNC